MSEKAVVGMPEGLRDIHEMCEKTAEMLRLTWGAFRRQDTAPLQRAEQLGREVHQQEKALTEAFVKRLPGSPGAGGTHHELFFVPMHLERIGDNIEFLIKAIRSMVRDGTPFTERAMREVNTLFEKAIELIECVRDLVPTKNRVLIGHILKQGEWYAELANEYALAHQQRLIEGVCMAKASSLYLAIVDYLKGIEWHTRQIAQKLSLAQGV